jgi:hypothetical protein
VNGKVYMFVEELKDKQEIKNLKKEMDGLYRLDA